MAKILVVDDDKNIIKLLQFLLNQEGHTVLFARDGEAGLTIAQKERPDLIILDVMMPAMDGFSVSASLFKDTALRGTPVVILTAKGSSREIFKLVPNVRLYMDKPFDSQDFLNHIRKILPSSAQNS